MKSLLLFTALIIACGMGVTRAQDVVPNGDFETWSVGEPADWVTANLTFAGSVTQTSDAHSGSWAAQGNAVEVAPGISFGGWLQTEMAPGFPVTQRWTTLHGFYKFVSVESDVFFVMATAYRDGATTGAGAFLDSVSTVGYSEFILQINYVDGSIPDSISIYVTMGPGGGAESMHAGSQFKIDDFSLGMDSVAACPIAVSGDVNDDGEVKSSDIVYLVNYVLKGGDEPIPCQAAGDANADGEVKSSDIVFLVNYVLKGGAAPPDICSLIPFIWSCP